MRCPPIKISRELRAAAGFTLVEIMVVLGIISIMMSIVVMGARKTWETQEIRASALKLAADLTLASQLAVKWNQPVEVRFYSYMDEAIASTMPQFRAYQLMDTKAIGIAGGTSGGQAVKLANPIYELQKFEGTTIMSSNNRKYSTLAVSPQKRQQGDPELGIGDYQYVSVEFRPDGTTNLSPPDGEPWTVTLGPVRWLEDSSQTPKYFQCIGIDWASGAVRIY